MSAYAGLVTRVSALVVDGILMAVVVPAVASGPSSLWESLDGQAPGWLKATSQLVAGLVPVFYFALCWWGTGQTLGGLLLGPAVPRPGGAHLSPVRAALRALGGPMFPVSWL